MNYKVCILSIILPFTVFVNTCFSQDSNYLSKRLDSLKGEQSRLLNILDRVNAAIIKTENQITALTLNNEKGVSDFRKVSILRCTQ